ncbi:sulfurtransferase [Hydrocarboniclastica marina]|uniref:Sulfurtransferase n=1 Tax=Hydrocarboniclastica marina TaxID=2259620 RepID=A0A4P7XHU5_9ALTE|nr:rhodanese-like domain-containing protein [Hydrocarboniclastica marina]QCF26628.1 sulfurtransferase [Hydrocarboniclastica marina]
MTALPLLIEPEMLEAHLHDPGLLLVDLCHPERYAVAHLPGAVHVQPQETQRGRPPAPGALPDRASLQALVDRIGLQPEHHVVVYDDEGGGWAGRFVWLLDAIGHRHYSLLNGGWIAWSDEGRPLTAEKPERKNGNAYPLELSAQPTADLNAVLSALDDPDVVIWDARSPAEYRGERQAAAKSGHIPGARNLEWTQTMDPARSFRLRDEAELRQQLAAAGIDLNKHIITHCQSHHRSGLTYAIAKHLGAARVQAYAGSWAEWGNHPNTPVER